MKTASRRLIVASGEAFVFDYDAMAKQFQREMGPDFEIFEMGAPKILRKKGLRGVTVSYPCSIWNKAAQMGGPHSRVAGQGIKVKAELEVTVEDTEDGIGLYYAVIASDLGRWLKG